MGSERPLPFREAHERIVQVIRNQTVSSIEVGIWLKKIRDLRLYEWPAVTGDLFREAQGHIDRALDVIREGKVELRAAWERIGRSGEANAREYDTIADMVHDGFDAAADDLGIPSAARKDLLNLLIDQMEGNNG